MNYMGEHENEEFLLHLIQQISKDSFETEDS